MKMTLSHRFLNVNLDILHSLGFEKATALDVLNFDPARLDNFSDRMSLDPFVDCLNAAAKATSDPNIALRLGYKFRVGTFGQTGGVYAYCQNLKDVILMNDRYQKIAIDAGHAEYDVDSNGRHHMCFLPHYSDMERYRPITDMIMASYVTTYRWLSWGSGEKILSACLPYAEPDDNRFHNEIFQSDIHYESETCRLEFSENSMTQTLTTYDPERFTKAQIKLDKILGFQMAAQSFERAIAAAIRGAIDSGQVSSEIVAQRMGMNSSTFRAKLNESGKGMRQRLDRMRKTMFIEKHEKGQSFSEIAVGLAYNDQAAMNRAFSRWFGMTPSEWRRQEAKVTD